MLGGVVAPAPRVALASLPPMAWTCVANGATSRHPLAKQIASRTSRYFGGPRRSDASQRAMRVLTRRGSDDLVNQLRFHRDCALPASHGVLNPEVVEWLHGLVRGYTEVRPSEAASPSVKRSRASPSVKRSRASEAASPSKRARPSSPSDAPRRLRCLDLFSGCGAAALGLAPYAEVVGLCENDAACREVLAARQASGHLPRAAPIFGDVRGLGAEHLAGLGRIDLVQAAWPCQDIAVCNVEGRGLDGRRSGLFTEVVRVVALAQPVAVFLENSSNLTSARHHASLAAVLQALDGLGYDARWCVVEARHAGLPMRRARFFLLATRRDQALTLRPRAVASPSTPRHMPPPEAWLLPTPMSKATKRRLDMLGNVVPPAQVRLAFEVLLRDLDASPLAPIGSLQP